MNKDGNSMDPACCRMISEDMGKPWFNYPDTQPEIMSCAEGNQAVVLNLSQPDLDHNGQGLAVQLARLLQIAGALVHLALRIAGEPFDSSVAGLACHSKSPLLMLRRRFRSTQVA